MNPFTLSRPRSSPPDSLPRWYVFLMLGSVALVIVLTAAFWHYTQDDVFITYVYSRHLATGEGFVFNPGERVQGTTTPLYTLLMAGVYLLTDDLLHAGNLLSGIMLLVAGGLALYLLRPYAGAYARAALALTLAVSPLVYASFGMETLFYSALLMLALALWSRGHHVAAMIAAAAATWTRADGIVLAGALGLAALTMPELRRWRTLARLALAYLAAIAPWFVFAWAYFGTPLPQTFSAKEAMFQGTLFWSDGWMWWESIYGGNPLTLLAIPLVGIGTVQALARPALRPLGLWPLLYTLGYTILNVTAFWYYTPLVISWIVLAALGGDWLARRLVRRWKRRTVIALCGGLVIVTALLAGLRAWRYRQPPPRMATYQLVGEWIRAHTPPDSTLLVKDLGVVGYYARRPTLDSFGLIVPDMHFTTDAYAAAKFKPDYVVTTQYWEMQRLAAADWFNYHYRPVAQFSTPGDDEFSPMTVFRRRLALETPVQAVQGHDLPLTCTVVLAAGDPLPGETRAWLHSDTHQGLVAAAHPFLWDQYPAARAAADESLIEQIALPLTVAPGVYRWELSCADRVTTGTVEVLPVDQAAGYVPADVTWEPFVRLRGFALPQGDSVWSGGALDVVFDWQVLAPAPADYSLFVHLVDEQGAVVAQADGFPQDRPATTYAPQEQVIDRRELRLPPDAPPGDYRLVIGWYDWRTDGFPRVTLPGGADHWELPVTIRVRWPGGSGRPAE